MQPAFHRQRPGRFADTMTSLADEMLVRSDGIAEQGRPIAVWREMVKLTLSIV